MREQEIQKYTISRLEKIGAYVVKVMVANRSGTPDLLVCYQGNFFAVEVKSQNGKVSPLQELTLKKILRAGGKTWIIHSKEQADEMIYFIIRNYGVCDNE